MSEHPTFDRAKGFVALPVELLDYDLTPGAFRLLTELCRMANLDGYCWPSLGQLGDRLGRSRASVSAYVAELRAADLLETASQRTANGYNYRLKYRLTFWAEWRAGLRVAKSAPQKTEHRVQPAERLSKTQNQNHKNQTTGEVSNLQDLAMRWAECFRGAPYPAARIEPDAGLLAQTKKVLQEAPRKEIISTDIAAGLAQFWKTRGVEIAPIALRQQAEHLAKKHMSESEFAIFLDRFAKSWPPHWRRAPDAAGFAVRANECCGASLSEVRSVLEGYLRRWAAAQKVLRPCALSASLVKTERAAA